MKKWQQTLLNVNMTILEVLEIIDRSSLQIGIVIDENQCLLGTVTDGDIRRGLLKGLRLDENIAVVMNKKPFVVVKGFNEKELAQRMVRALLRQVPVVDQDKKICDIFFLEDYLRGYYHDNYVVIMAGGLGTRLGELTANCPKPLLSIGGKPVLETIIDNFKENGFNKFILAVNYKADMIEDYFGDGIKHGVEINYLKENKRLGTAGPLSLFVPQNDQPIMVMNGDLLTKLDFKVLLDTHNKSGASATMCVREYSLQVPYGVVNAEDSQIISIEEKPTHKFFVNAGIYVLEPKVLKLIPKDTYYDMPTLFSDITKQNMDTRIFPVIEYWMDIGRRDDLEQASSEYREVFS